MSSENTLVLSPSNKWVGASYLNAVFGMTDDALDNYRRIWMQGRHYRKIGPSGKPSQRRAKILYNLPEINKWIESYPQQ